MNNTKVRFQDLRIEDKELRERLHKVLDQSLDSGQLLPSIQVEQFESSMKKFFNIRQAHFLASGTAALEMALKALDIKNGDEVILPTISWVATAHAVRLVGATPVFADIDENLQIDLKSIERMITKRSKAIIVVHFGGLSTEMETLQELARSNNLKLIEDCSQAFGNEYSNKKLGTFGDFGCFSLNPMKIFGALGESGFIISHHQISEEFIYCGVDKGKNIVSIERNNRGDELQAGFLNVLFENLETKKLRILKKISMYNELLPSFIGKNSSNALYCINTLVNNRHLLEEELQDQFIEFKRLHIPLMCELEVYKDCRADAKNSRELAKKLITLPFHLHLEESDIKRISSIVRRYL